MTQEERIDRLEAKTSELDRKVDLIAAKVDATLEGLNDFKAEMRQQNEMRANEITETRAEMRSLGEKIDGMSKHVQNLVTAATVGIGAAVIGVLAIAGSVIGFVYNVVTTEPTANLPAQPPAQTTTLKVIPK